MTELSGGRFYPGLISFPGVLPLLDHVESVAETQGAAREQSTVSTDAAALRQCRRDRWQVIKHKTLSCCLRCCLMCDSPYQPVCIFMKSWAVRKMIIGSILRAAHDTARLVLCCHPLVKTEKCLSVSQSQLCCCQYVLGLTPTRHWNCKRNINSKYLARARNITGKQW